MTAPLVPVVERARPRTIDGQPAGAEDVLECGHAVLFDGSYPGRRRCPECPPEPGPEPDVDALVLFP